MLNASIKDKSSIYIKNWLFFYLWIFFGIFLILILSSLLSWNTFQFWKIKEGLILIIICTCSYFISLFVLSKTISFPRIEHTGSIIVIIFSFFLLTIGILALGRIYYSRTFVISFYTFSLLWFLLGYRTTKKKNNFIFVLPLIYRDLEIPKTDNVNYIFLDSPYKNAINKTDGIIISDIEKLTPEWARFLVQQASKGIPIYHISDIYENLLGKIPIKYFKDDLLENFCLSTFTLLLKRFLDISIVLISLPFVIPIGILISVLIKLDSDGPIFFTQERVGQGGKIFKMIKFRTMYKDAEKNGPSQATKDDPRITKIGKILRKFRLDEIPQFINVIKGEMSLIGPRPEQVKFVEEYERKIPFYSYRHLVKPGITGWAQIQQGYASGIEENTEKLEYDLYYIKNISIWLDIVIILKTIKVLFSKWGAR